MSSQTDSCRARPAPPGRAPLITACREWDFSSFRTSSTAGHEKFLTSMSKIHLASWQLSQCSGLQQWKRRNLQKVFKGFDEIGCGGSSGAVRTDGVNNLPFKGSWNPFRFTRWDLAFKRLSSSSSESPHWWGWLLGGEERRWDHRHVLNVSCRVITPALCGPGGFGQPQGWSLPSSGPSGRAGGFWITKRKDGDLHKWHVLEPCQLWGGFVRKIHKEICLFTKEHCGEWISFPI